MHDFAVQLLANKGLNSLVLALFRENYQKADDKIYCEQSKKSTSIHHHVKQDIAYICTNHCSEAAFDTLIKVYQEGNCSFCRYGLVKAMKHCHVLTESIIEEYLYDCCNDTQKLANRIRKVQ